MGLFTTPSLLVGFISIIPHEENNIDLQVELLADLTHDPNPDRFDGVPPEYQPEKVMVASLGSIRDLLVQSVVGQTTGDQKVYYFINDHLGTPQKLLNENADVVWRADYKPFGEADVDVNTFSNRFRFPGQSFDAETGLHYNYYRYYDSQTGRYLRADPIGLNGGLNLYSYVLNDPVNWNDPWGLKSSFGRIVVGLDPGAHPVFQYGTYENQLIGNDLKKIFKLFNPTPAVTSAMRRFHENSKSRINDKTCQGNDKNPHKLSPSEIDEMNERAKIIATDMRYQQLSREMENWHLR